MHSTPVKLGIFYAILHNWSNTKFERPTLWGMVSYCFDEEAVAMPGEPNLGKHPADPRRDYKPMTWERFLLLRAWAKWIAWHEHCTVTLVGSVLEKQIPRDIDIALIWPVAEFEAMFGPLPTNEEEHKALWKSRAFEDKWIGIMSPAQNLVKFDTRIDVRLCPDTWWPEKDRLILATPGEVEPPNRFGDVEFAVNRVVRKGDPEWTEE